MFGLPDLLTPFHPELIPPIHVLQLFLKFFVQNGELLKIPSKSAYMTEQRL